MGVYSYSVTAGSNTIVASVSIAEGMAPADVNNAIRGLMADLAKFLLDIGGKTSLGGSADAYTLTTSSTIASYADGQIFVAICNASNTGASTINVDTVGTVKIRKVTSSSTNDVALIANDMRANQPVMLVYDASADTGTGAFILLNPLSGLADGILTTRGDIIVRNATGPTRLALGTSGYVLKSDGTDAAWAAETATSFASNSEANAQAEAAKAIAPAQGPALLGSLKGYGYGCTVSNNGSDATNDLDFTAGVWADSTGTVMMTVAAMTKRLDAGWAAATTNGLRNSGASIADTTYHIYVVAKAGGADADYYAHTSTTVSTVITALQAETSGADYLYARRIFSIIRESSAIRTFTQNGDEVLWMAGSGDVNSTNPGTSAVTPTLKVPAGIKVDAILSGQMVVGATGSTMLVTSPDQTDSAVSATALFTMRADLANLIYAASLGRVRTNTSAQIRYKLSASDASTVIRIVTHGYVDTRGRLA